MEQPVNHTLGMKPAWNIENCGSAYLLMDKRETSATMKQISDYPGNHNSTQKNGL